MQRTRPAQARSLAADLCVLRTMTMRQRMSRLVSPLVACVCIVLLSIPGTFGFAQPPHLRWYGVERVDIALCGAATGALLVALALALALLTGAVRRWRQLSVLALPFAASAWGLTLWWTSLLLEPHIPWGVIF